MAPVKYERVVSFSSEDPNQPAENIITVGPYRKWRCKLAGEPKAWIELQLEKMTSISAVDIGNHGSAFIEILVGRSGCSEADYKVVVLLNSASFMTPQECRNETHLQRVRIFKYQDLNKATQTEKWDRIRVVCTQPFNKQLQYGLTFITVHAPEEEQAKPKSNETSNLNLLGGLLKLREEPTFDSAKQNSFSRFRSISTNNSSLSSSQAQPGAIRAASQSLAAVALAQSELEAEKILKHTPLKGESKDLADKGIKSQTSGPIPWKSLFATAQTLPLQFPNHQNVEADRPKHTLESTMLRKNSQVVKTYKDKQLSSDSQWKEHLSKARDESPPLPSRKEVESDKPKQPTTPSILPTVKTPKVHSSSTSKEAKRVASTSKEAERVASTSKEAERVAPVKRKSSLPSPIDNTPPLEEKKKQTRPFNRLLSGDVIVISGFQNPLRSHLRDMIFAMGAKYKPDWDPTCTHLVCAFANTPKFNAVKGKGKIVTRQWIEDCFAKRKRYPWRRYCLDKKDRKAESEEEIWAEDDSDAQGPTKPKRKKTLSDIEPPSTTFDTEDKEYAEATDVDGFEDTDDEIDKVKKKILEEKFQEEKLQQEKAQKEKSEDTDDEIDQIKKKIQEEKIQKEMIQEKIQEKTQEKTQEKIQEKLQEQIQEKIQKENIPGDIPEEDIQEEACLHQSQPLDFFSGSNFFLGKDLSDDLRQKLTERITRFKGNIIPKLRSKVTYFITDTLDDDSLTKAKSKNNDVKIVKTKWINKCKKLKQFVSPDNYLVELSK